MTSLTEMPCGDIHRPVKNHQYSPKANEMSLNRALLSLLEDALLVMTSMPEFFHPFASCAAQFHTPMLMSLLGKQTKKHAFLNTCASRKVSLS